MERSHAAGNVPALVTLLNVSGSAYRRPGSKILVDAGGETTCMISGGCLEPELAEIARAVVASDTPRRVRYDFNEDEVWGLGLGCGGSIDLYIEPAPAGSGAARWVSLQASGKRAVSAMVFAESDSERAFYCAEVEPEAAGPAKAGAGRPAAGRRESEAGEAARAESDPWPQIERRARELLEEGERRSRLESVSVARRPGSEGLEAQAEFEVFFDISGPMPELVLVGGGPDAVPLARYGADIGFRVTVVDPREGVAAPASFPDAVLVPAHPAELTERVSIGPESFVVIMNHHTERDREALVRVIEGSPAYVGVLGPRRRFERLLEPLRAEGSLPDDGLLDRVHNPVGLDIGAEGPEEIALSVLAEILAVRRGFTGGKLTGKGSGIHEPSPKASSTGERAE